MPVKNTLAKKTKKPAEPVIANESDDSEDDAPVLPTKIKMPVDLEDADSSVPLVEDKADGDPLLADQEIDDMTDDSGIEDEIDPFGDKWEA